MSITSRRVMSWGIPYPLSPRLAEVIEVEVTPKAATVLSLSLTDRGIAPGPSHPHPAPGDQAAYLASHFPEQCLVCFKEV